MTVAIQGDWGAGKSTTLKLIRANLPIKSSETRDSASNSEERETNGILLIEFNTWPYSQFNLGDRLPFSLMETIISQLKEKVKAEQSRFQSEVQEVSTPLLTEAFNKVTTIRKDVGIARLLKAGAIGALEFAAAKNIMLGAAKAAENAMVGAERDMQVGQGIFLQNRLRLLAPKPLPLIGRHVDAAPHRHQCLPLGKSIRYGLLVADFYFSFHGIMNQIITVIILCKK